MTGALGLTLSLVFASPSWAASIKNDFECFADSRENEVCLVTPPNAASAKISAPAAATEVTPSAIGMVSNFELSGAAARGPTVSQTNLATLAPELDPALGNARRGQDSIRWVENFLKAGPASAQPDLRVSTAGRKSK